MDVALAQALVYNAFQADRAVLVLRKHRDVQQDQAAALLQLVRQAAPDGTGQLIDVRG
jgi:hypothetical protein